jgi:hypothetical protein
MVTKSFTPQLGRCGHHPMPVPSSATGAGRRAFRAHRPWWPPLKVRVVGRWRVDVGLDQAANNDQTNTASSANYPWLASTSEPCASAIRNDKVTRRLAGLTVPENRQLPAGRA